MRCRLRACFLCVSKGAEFYVSNHPMDEIIKNGTGPEGSHALQMHQGQPRRRQSCLIIMFSMQPCPRWHAVLCRPSFESVACRLLPSSLGCSAEVQHSSRLRHANCCTHEQPYVSSLGGAMQPACPHFRAALVAFT